MALAKIDDLEPADPRMWQSQIEGFVKRPLTRKEHEGVIRVLEALPKRTTIAFKIELAAVLVGQATEHCAGAAGEVAPNPFDDYRSAARQVIDQRVAELRAQGRI